MFLDLAYSSQMQFILAVQTFITNICIVYFMSDLLLMLSNEHASKQQRLIFAFCIGTVHTSFIYCVYIIGGMISFSPIVYLLVVSPNPILGYLYYIIGIKVFKLSPIRSIKLMGYFFTYFIFIVNITRLNTTLIPIETLPRYNYLQNIERQFVYLLEVYLIYCLIKYVIKKFKFTMRLSEKIFINIKKEKTAYLLKLMFLYILTTILPLLIEGDLLGSVTVLLVLIFFLAFNIVQDLFVMSKNELENKEVHINVLSKGINEFSSIEHDFYNILQTYNGYLEIGDLESLKKYHSSLIKLTTYAGSSIDLSRKMKENPAFVSLLVNKIEYAKKMNVEMMVSLQDSTANLYIDNIDICRCIACLLDNAIESASISKQKKVFFTLESKESKLSRSKLIIVANSTDTPIDISKIINPGVTSKSGHHGIGLSNVREIIKKYGNSTFQMTYYNYELCAYIELRQN